LSPRMKARISRAFIFLGPSFVFSTGRALKRPP
jgi:hypothetical protein